MGSDRERVSYDANQQYRAVVAQQGRVILEADWNEAQQIASEEQREHLLDIIGSSCTPDDGYRVLETGSVPLPPFDFLIQKGTMYVGGMRAVLPNTIQYSEQSDWLDWNGDPEWVDPSTPKNTPEFIYLLLREQEISAVEDSTLREPALGGPDTTQRTRLIQRIVRLNTEGKTCETALDLAQKQWLERGLRFDSQTMRLMSAATLQVSFLESATPPDLCDPEARGGYLGAENQLIRVKISAVDAANNQYKLVWGFDNASFLYRVSAINSTTLTLQSQPVDDFHRPRTSQAVEVLRSAARLSNKEYVAAANGSITTLTAPYSPDTQTVTLPAPLPAEYLDSDQTPQLFLRVWEEELLFTPGNPVSLGKTGLQVTLGISGGQPFHMGDYWFFAVRPTTPSAVYPQRYLDAPQTPEGPRLWVCPLAVIEVIGAAARSIRILQDCRHKFRSLCEVGGGDTVTADFAHICAINWVHPTPPLANPTNLTSTANLNRDGVLIAFDRPVLNSDIHQQSFMVLVKHRDDRSNTDCWCELPIKRVGGVQFERACEILSGFTETNDPNAAVNGAQFRPGLNFVATQEYRVLLKGNFIRDAKNEKGIDADHLPPWLPKRPTGDGNEGGTFESWFVTVAPVPAKVIRVEPPNGAEFNSSGEAPTIPPPPDFVEIFFDKSLQGATVNANTVRVLRSIDSMPAESWLGTVAYDDATQSARFTPQLQFGTGPSTTRIFTLTLFGDGPNRILDVDGLALDGNSDGSPGGDFTSTFTVFHISG